MPSSSVLSKRLAYLPLGWIGLFALFVVVKRLQYSSCTAMLREDPKDLGMQLPHDFLVFAGLHVFLVHPLICVLGAAALRVGNGHRPRRREVGLAALCYAAFLLFCHYLPQPIINWFGD